jgi:hypothetical protein
MPTALYHLTTISAIAVLIVLVFGLRTMMTGESPSLSQKLMRWRVGLQFAAIIVIMTAVYFRR